MKKKGLVIIPILIVIITAIVAIILTNQKKPSFKIATVAMEHNYLNVSDRKIAFKLFLNRENHKVLYKENIVHCSLSDEEEKNYFEIKLLDIDYSHEEKYLDDTFYAFNFSFLLPKVDYNLSLYDARLELVLVTGETYLLKIGTFRFIEAENIGAEPYFKVLSLYGFKQENSKISRLSKILLKKEDVVDYKIDSITIDGIHQLEYLETEDQIEIQIPKDTLALNQAPLIFTLLVEGIEVSQVIDNFTYFSDFNILSESEGEVNVFVPR